MATRRVDLRVASIGDAPERTVAIPVDGSGQTTLRAILERLIRDELAQHAGRRREARLVRALTEDEVAEQRQAGRVGGAPDGRDDAARTVPVKRLPPAEHALAVALDALRRGRVLAAIDGAAVPDAAATVRLGPDSTLTLVRLVGLRAG